MTSRPFPYSLSVFFPAFNDAPSLPSLIQATFEVLDAHAPNSDVLVVNDGSRDCTSAVLAELQIRFGPRLRVVTHPVNQGYGAALRSGFAHATGDFIFYTDGDAQYDVRELPLLLDLVESPADWINGHKIARQDPIHRRYIGSAYRRFVRWLFNLRLHDIDCDFRLISRRLLSGADLRESSGAICVELVHALESNGAQAREVGVHHYPRVHGRSQFFRPVPLMRTFKQLFLLYWRLH